MFDITSSKLLLLGVVALLVIGPKDLPGLLRTIGKYMGIVKKQAAEFRAQFDEAMRESELQQLKKDVESLQHETESTMRSAEQTLESELSSARSLADSSVDAAIGAETKTATDAVTHDADGQPKAIESAAAGGLNGAGGADKAGASPASETAAEPDKPAVKTGA